MTANHAPGCPAIADVRDGCSCLLRGVAAQEDHEPECPGYPYTDDPSECICAALRACEARAYVAGVERENRSYGFAFQQGLDAAMKAVAAELDSYRADCINDNKIISLIAVDTFRHTMRTIDALKEQT